MAKAPCGLSAAGYSVPAQPWRLAQAQRGHVSQHTRCFAFFRLLYQFFNPAPSAASEATPRGELQAKAPPRLLHRGRNPQPALPRWYLCPWSERVVHGARNPLPEAGALNTLSGSESRCSAEASPGSAVPQGCVAFGDRGLPQGVGGWHHLPPRHRVPLWHLVPSSNKASAPSSHAVVCPLLCLSGTFFCFSVACRHNLSP